MKKLLFALVLALGPASFGQSIMADYSAFIDLGIKYLDNTNECLAGADAAIVYYHKHPKSSVMRVRNFIQGDVCARPGGNLLKLPNYPLRSYQHSSAWRYYNLVFDGQDNCGVLYFSGTAKYMGEIMTAKIEDYSANRCHQLIPPARVIITEFQSEGYFNQYFYMGLAHEQAHHTIFD